VIRLTCIALSVIALSPLGCPLFDGGTDQQSTPPPGSITTSATGPARAQVGETVELRATAATDGSPVYFAWLQTAGPGVQIQDADQATARFIAPSLPTEQTLVFLVTAYNDAGATGQAEVRVVVAADPDYKPFQFTPGTGATGATGPTAEAGNDQSVRAGDQVTLDGTASRGSGLTYRWRQVSGPTATLADATAARTTFVAPQYSKGNDELVFELAVTDRNGRSATDRVIVRIRSTANPRVQVSTSMGNFTIELEQDRAPISVQNFLRYVDEGFYDGTIFHRVIAGFVVQGGGFTPGMNQKTTHDPIANESNNGLKNRRGTVAMARTSDPNSATSQWYVNLVDNPDLDRTTSNPGYAVFGLVVEGMDVVDRIATVQTGSRFGYQDVPLTDVVINSVRRITPSSGGNGEQTANPAPLQGGS